MTPAGPRYWIYCLCHTRVPPHNDGDDDDIAFAQTKPWLILKLRLLLCVFLFPHSRFLHWRIHQLIRQLQDSDETDSAFGDDSAS